MKHALITGITGQDGSYLAELLLGSDYKVIGASRRVSTTNDERIRHLLGHPNFEVVNGDVTDALCVAGLVRKYQPDELYNLAAQSHVGVSFTEPAHTTQVSYLGCLYCLESVRLFSPRTKFYQASSSEIFGRSYNIGADGWCCQNEQTPMLPNSPYAIAKLAAHNLVRVYREGYGLFACSGILFNHESPRRGDQFVTKKICRYLARYVQHGDSERLVLGNLNSCRDWGHAKDYVLAMWQMLQQTKPDDFIIATGETRTVREFLHEAIEAAGLPDLLASGQVRSDDALFRPNEVPFLRGDASKAKRVLGWCPRVSFKELVREMVLHEVSL